MKKILLLTAALTVGLAACVPSQSAESSALSSAAVISETPESLIPDETSAVIPSASLESEAVPVESESPDAELSSEPAESESPEPLASTGRTGPSDEEVLQAYRDATEANAWFAGYDDSGLLLDAEDICTVGERTYYRVTRGGLENMDSLRAYLKTLFSDEVVDSLLSPEEEQFTDGPDGLYALPAGRGSDITRGGTTTAVLWPEEEDPVSCTVRVTVEIVDPMNGGIVVDQQSYDFPYTRVGEKWVFTQFETIF